MMSPDELRAWKFGKDGNKSLYDDELKNHIIDDENAMNTKVFSGPKFKEKNYMNKLFKHLPGDTKLVDRVIKARTQKHKNLKLFGDRDKDNILNVFDKNPYKKNKRML